MHGLYNVMSMSSGMDMRGPVRETRCSHDRACDALWIVHAQLKPMLARIIEVVCA